MNTPETEHEPPLYFIFDVESIGLHGEAFAVAGGLYQADGATIHEFSYSCDPDHCQGDPDDRAWVDAHVPKMEITHSTTVALRNSFWTHWADARQRGALMLAHCLWPVEARFLASCIDDAPEARKWQGPYPLHEIGSFMLAAGIDPVGDFPRNENELPAHAPLADVRHSLRLLLNALNSCATQNTSASTT